MTTTDYEVQRTSIQVKTTDGDPSTWPNTDLRIRNGDYALFFYEVNKDCPVFRHWMETLGDVVSNIEDTDVSYVLQDFPPGYKLFFHAKFPASLQIDRDTLPMTAVHTACSNGLVERTDIYLFGLPSGRRFRSKNEFIPHFRWLYSGGNKKCECRYCNVGVKKNKQLKQKLNVPSQDYNKIMISDKDRDHETMSHFFGPIYRPGEIVWIVGPNQNLMSTSDENERDVKEYYNWPGYVVDISEQGERSSDYLQTRETIYEVRLLALDRTRYYPESSLIPWIVREAKPSFDTESLIDTTYNQAINIANAFQRSFVMNKEYKYRISDHAIASAKSKEQKKRLKNSKKCPHYNEMVFGTEVIRTNDFVRLTLEEDEVSSNKSLEMEFFRIVTMYRLKNNQIQFTGDLYVRKYEGDNIIKELGMSEDDERLQRMLTIGSYKYIPKNFSQEEYTVDMEDLAGRFYIDWEELTEPMNLTEETEEKFSKNIDDYSVVQEKKLENYDNYDDESDSQMSDIESLSTITDLNQSFINSIDDESSKSLNDMDNNEFMIHQNSLQLRIYDREQHGTIFPALHSEQSQDDYDRELHKMDLRFLLQDDVNCVIEERITLPW